MSANKMKVRSTVSNPNYLKGKQMYKEAEICLIRGLILKVITPKDIHGSIEAYQHGFELLLKSLFLIHGLKPPEIHDTAKSIDKLTTRMNALPIKFDHDVWELFKNGIKIKSERYARMHHEVIYGDEENNIPASQLFDKPDLEEIANDAHILNGFLLGPLLIIGEELDLLSEEEKKEFDKMVVEAKERYNDPEKEKEIRKKAEEWLKF
jgi:hypothetical protein